MNVLIANSRGNRDLLNLSKTAFFCSRRVESSAILPCYDWAIEQRELGTCVISGFHSKIEKDVLHYLLKGNQPIIMVLARGLMKNVEPLVEEGIQKGRILILSPFTSDNDRMTRQSIMARNELILQLADQIVVGYADQAGNLRKVVERTSKPVTYLLPTRSVYIDHETPSDNLPGHHGQSYSKSVGELQFPFSVHNNTLTQILLLP
jgi:hypothetical protein